ncbi:hypothetical protein F4813DRAFT_367479 [Daldinia decipiens]|uniref:uncharacterized protein n=1 Tax=Daldinia decipiens TaxID=326647 RepID=UPI0020C22DDE|nr:uncharacterized protein F4813DRAFT_367479 [Daldinia decipiens]KAI1655307.1 hypothetical protein F4813DRAFT_367479 [Daldinia decipiens]
MTSDVNISRRPGLEPIWTNSHRAVNAMPKTILRPTPISVGLPQSPISPKSLPTLPSPNPVHPASYDGSMRRQDRALVNSLDHRTMPSLSSAPLTPIDEYSPSPLVARLERISILPSMNIGNGALTPASSDASSRRESLLSLDGSIPVAMHEAPSEYQVRSPSYYNADYTSMSPGSPRRDAALRLRDQLGVWGPVYFGNSKMADAFIIARSLRQHSCSSPTSPAFVKSPAGAPPNKRLTVRAIVRPQSQDRPAFLIQRNFDIDQLRATIPDPPPHIQANSGPDRQRSPSRSSASVPTQSSRRRSSTVRSGALLRSDANTLDLESLIRDARAIPMHLPYARAYLPVVAALLTSGHVREGDVVYLPMPHAEAWHQTVQYVYTGQAELTEEVRENILYLAGKV